MTMKEKIQELCRERDISVRQLERMAGLKERTIQHWDDSDPSGNKLSNIALALKIPIEELCFPPPCFSLFYGTCPIKSRLFHGFCYVLFLSFS